MFRSNTSYDIIAVGSATRDVLMKSEQFKIIQDQNFATGQGECFALGSKIEIKDIYFVSGGGGTNAATTFARQGLKTACIGAISDDFNGRDVAQELEREGVDTRHFQRFSGGYTAYSVILVHESGERTILSYKGEGQSFDVKKIPFSKLKSRWLFLDSLGGHYDMLEQLVAWAVKNKVKLATNPGGKELAHGLEKLRPLLKNFSIVIMNQEESAGLLGIPYEQESVIFKKMTELTCLPAGRSTGIFVMTKGPKGVVVSDGHNVYRAGVPDSPVVERTGAGDAFSSGFVTEYIHSGDIAKAIQFATANASSVVTEYGAKAGILRKNDWGKWPLVKVSISPRA